MKRKNRLFYSAKGSSTRLPGKNNKDLLGSLWCMSSAKEAQLFGAEIYLSTVGQEIQKQLYH